MELTDRTRLRLDQEWLKAKRGLPPKGCYEPTLFGCGIAKDGSLMCRDCPWREWSIGQPVPRPE